MAGESAERHVEREEDAVRELNKASKEIAREIEQVVLSRLPPDPLISAQAEIRFRPAGSIVMIGTLAVLSWTGSIVLEEVRAQLVEVVKIVVQRVVGEALARIAPDQPPMWCNVTERTASTVPASAAGTSAPSGPPVRASGSFDWRDFLLILLALAALVLLLDRFFEISPRTVALPPAGGQTAGLTAPQ